MSRWGGARGGEKEGMIILVLQYWTSFNPHHVLMSVWWHRPPQLPPTHTLWRQTGTRADAAPMKTDLCGLYASCQSWEHSCAACGPPIIEGPCIAICSSVSGTSAGFLQLWPCINNLCRNRLWFLRAPYRSRTLRPGSWTDRPLLGWRSPRNTAWGGYDALPPRCWKGLEVSGFLQLCIPVPIFQQPY